MTTEKLFSGRTALPTVSRLALLVTCVCLLGIVAVGGVATAETTEATETPVADVEVVGPVAVGSAQDHVEACAETPPADHGDPDGDTEDVIGWVDGYWYDEPLEFDDGALEEDELESLVSRTAARVEALRCHAFEDVPPIEMVTREEYLDEIETDVEETVDEEEQLFENAQLATLLLVGQDEDAIDAIIENQAAFPAAYYDVEDEVIGFVTDDPDAVEVDQVTLAHELTHALQDQAFELDGIFEEKTNDGFVSSLAVAEGDAVLTDGMYEANCGAEWVDQCFRVQPPVQEPPNWGLTLNLLAAYNTPLVAETYEEEGWDGVDEIYEDMPDSMVEAIYPEEYGEFEPKSLTVEDRSTGEWERVTMEDREFDVVGQHGVTAALIAPSFETQGTSNVIDPVEFEQPHEGGTFNYDHSATDGWQGDEFYAYANDDGDTAGVWKLAWADSDEAETFADAYTDLVEFRGGEAVEDGEDVFTFEETDEYEMAVGIERDDDRVWIVTAPTVDDLSHVHADLEFAEIVSDDDEDDADGAADGDDGDDAGETDDADDGEDAISGFSVSVAIASLSLALLLVRRPLE